MSVYRVSKKGIAYHTSYEEMIEENSKKELEMFQNLDKYFDYRFHKLFLRFFDYLFEVYAFFNVIQSCSSSSCLHFDVYTIPFKWSIS